MKNRRVRAALLFALATSAAAIASADDFATALADWKQNRLDRLHRPDGWLTLVGLAWLHPGDNPVGSASDATVRLPAGKAPERVGVLRLDGEHASFTASPGLGVKIDGQPRAAADLLPDSAKDGPTVVAVGSLSFYVIDRAGRYGVRVKDAEAETLKHFLGLDYYPADPRWRVPARFEPAPPGSRLAVPNALGFDETIDQPGWVTFELGGASHRLVALDDTGDGRLFLVFGDKTNGRETYGGGRFLYTDPPVEGRVTIDFNRAYNPPCVFTPYATCPLPPPGNKLPIAVEAGEKKYAGAKH